MTCRPLAQTRQTDKGSDHERQKGKADLIKRIGWAIFCTSVAISFVVFTTNQPAIDTVAWALVFMALGASVYASIVESRYKRLLEESRYKRLIETLTDPHLDKEPMPREAPVEQLPANRVASPATARSSH